MVKLFTDPDEFKLATDEDGTGEFEGGAFSKLLFALLVPNVVVCARLVGILVSKLFFGSNKGTSFKRL